MASEELGLKGDGVERKSIKALDEAMGDLLGHRERRMKHGKLEKDSAAVVIALFKKHNVRTYTYDDRNYDLKSVEKVVIHKDDDDGE